MSKKMNDEREELLQMILSMTPDELSELIDRAKREPLLKDVLFCTQYFFCCCVVHLVSTDDVSIYFILGYGVNACLCNLALDGTASGFQCDLCKGLESVRSAVQLASGVICKGITTHHAVVIIVER